MIYLHVGLLALLAYISEAVGSLGIPVEVLQRLPPVAATASLAFDSVLHDDMVESGGLHDWVGL